MRCYLAADELARIAAAKAERATPTGVAEKAYTAEEYRAAIATRRAGT
jgi:hypothetical protein